MTVAVISGNRADRGPLTPVARALDAQWVHLEQSPATSGAVAALNCSNAIAQTVAELKAIDPEWVVVLGDRYEMLGATTAAHLMGYPIAHLSGGDITEGSQDNSMRHAITKMAHIHFPTNEMSAHNLVHNLGEEQWRVFMVGCPGIDNLKATTLLSKEATLKAIGFTDDYYLVAYQPATLANDPIGEANELVKALRGLGSPPCVFTTLNTDVYSREIQFAFSHYCLEARNSRILEMDSQLYLSTMKHSIAMVGNSSSGLYEAPSLKKAFVNVGERQAGRLAASSVIACPAEADAIMDGIKLAADLDCTHTVNPYGDGKAAERIKFVIANFSKQMPKCRQELLTKKWTLPATLAAKEVSEEPISRSIH